MKLPRMCLWMGVFALTGATVAVAADNSSETETRYLSGTGKDDAVLWEFLCTEGQNSGVWGKIHVPSCWEQEGYGGYNYGMPDKNAEPVPIAKEQGKYRLNFQVPKEWKDKVVRLVFDGSMTDTEAWVNGTSAGPVHQGSFYRFKYDVSKTLKYGESNLLEVIVSKVSANESVNRAERTGDYWVFGGIFRPVYLEVLPKEFVDRTTIDARADGSFSADLYLGDKLETSGRIDAQIYDSRGTKIGKAFGVNIPAGQSRVSLKNSSPGIKQWTAETPDVYRVVFTLSHSSGAVHTVSEKFGFRTFEVRPRDGLYLNGQKIILKGVDRHSFWPETARTLSRQISYDDVRLIKEMNMNAVRMSHYPPDAHFLEVCDELGLYVLDELAGWHRNYDTPTGKKLIEEMIVRDVNHPSILFWDNGNEGGWNKENDVEFAKWDPQQRHVLHPWELFGDVNTTHYKNYSQAQKFCEGPEIYMPTEFMHGLYDGGAGAGLWDRWELMRNSPIAAGGFIWALLDEGVVRTDQKERIDCQGNLAPDGIVGPHREKEGSFYTIKEIWSPIMVTTETFPDDFSGNFAVENRYDFISLNQCKFEWATAKFASPEQQKAGHSIVAGGEVAGPSIEPHSKGELKIKLPANWRAADVLYLTAKDPKGKSLWTWTWNLMKSSMNAPAVADAPSAPAKAQDQGSELVVTAGETGLRFSKANGELAGVSVQGKSISFGHGPRFLSARSENKIFKEIGGQSTLTNLSSHSDGSDVVIEANYSGNFHQARWRISPNGMATLDYEYAFDGEVDIMGINFDYPEPNMKAVRWLGMGPYRVWQNRMKGTHLDVWENTYNDPTPGESWSYPEFKGYFRDWQWATFSTKEGEITVSNGGASPFLGVYKPRDGRVGPLLTLPDSGITVLDVIPAIGEKFTPAKGMGPQSQPQIVKGVHRGTVSFHFSSNQAKL